MGIIDILEAFAIAATAAAFFVIGFAFHIGVVQ
jgi:hypothetical protein